MCCFRLVVLRFCEKQPLRLARALVVQICVAFICCCFFGAKGTKHGVAFVEIPCGLGLAGNRGEKDCRRSCKCLYALARYGCVFFCGPPKWWSSFWFPAKPPNRVPSKKGKPMCRRSIPFFLWVPLLNGPCPLHEP